MRQVHDYVIMDTFLKNELQCISMGTHASKTNEVALINEIEKGGILDNETFNSLTKCLTNLQFSNSDGKYTLITLYNEGVPFPTYMQNYNLQNDDCNNLLLKLLDKVALYNGLPNELLPLLIDENQIIISDGNIRLNEIINLAKYDTSVTFQDSLKIIMEKLLDLCNSKSCHAISDYLNSDQFYQEDNLFVVIEDIRRLVENNKADAAPPDIDSTENQQDESNDQQTEQVAEPFVYKFDVELDEQPDMIWQTSAIADSIETAENADLTKATESMETKKETKATKNNKATKPKRSNKPQKKLKRTRAQRRRRLIWLAVCIAIFIILKLMWPQ